VPEKSYPDQDYQRGILALHRSISPTNTQKRHKALEGSSTDAGIEREREILYGFAYLPIQAGIEGVDFEIRSQRSLLLDEL
jgi:hypothetical protein